MTIREKRAYLNGYKKMQTRIIGLTNELERWQNIATKVNNAMDITGVRGGGNDSKVERASVKTMDILADIRNDIIDAKKMRDHIIDTINRKSRKMRHRELLMMHFINGMSVPKIAKTLNKENKSVANAIAVAIRDLNI